MSQMAQCMQNTHLAIAVVAHSHGSKLNRGTESGRGVKCGDSGSSSAYALRQRALRCQLEVYLSTEIHFLERLVAARQ